MVHAQTRTQYSFANFPEWTKVELADRRAGMGASWLEDNIRRSQNGSAVYKVRALPSAPLCPCLPACMLAYLFVWGVRVSLQPPAGPPIAAA